MEEKVSRNRSHQDMKQHDGLFFFSFLFSYSLYITTYGASIRSWFFTFLLRVALASCFFTPISLIIFPAITCPYFIKFKIRRFNFLWIVPYHFFMYILLVCLSVFFFFFSNIHSTYFSQSLDWLAYLSNINSDVG